MSESIYQLCTPENPMPKGDSGYWKHSGAICTGECSEGCCDYFECSNCGHKWKQEASQ
jgi:hypothetical protein